ncbi:MAG: LCP family protein [Capsulimonadaceae bacterium]|nr:LCP family protein [Capsulimonadaceae bacterium]
MKSTTNHRSVWRTIGLTVLFVAAVALVAAIVVGVRAFHRQHGEQTGDGSDSWVSAMSDLGQVALNPRSGFQGKSRINILCMGIDDNWTNSDVVYTKGARTDTLFMLSLDMDNKKASILSIPRDADAEITGIQRHNKVNAAYATGGPRRAEATVANLIGVTPDYYIVIKIDGTKKMVDALGGVDVDVEHSLDYDDSWGHLHVHLLPGHQHLTGDQAVGFARYRHGNHGVTPEDGDERRIYRQHVLVRAMLDRFKNIANVIKPNELIDTAMSCIQTDMTRTQLFDLGALFHGVNQDDIETAQIPGTDEKGSGGMYLMKLDEDKMNLLVDWLLRGNETSGRAVTPVVVRNGTKVTGLAMSAGETLKACGYTDVHVGQYTKPGVVATTAVIDSGVSNRVAAREISGFLGISPAAILTEKPKPNKFGWTPPPAITIVLGTDYATAHPPATSSSSATGQTASTSSGQ